jgi:pyruvate kinase
VRKTKIIATIGPATRSPEMMRQLIEAGMNVVRINMSHSGQDEAAGVIADLRTISDRVGVLVDTKGPEIRTAEVDNPFTIEQDDLIVIRGEPGPSVPGLLRVTHPSLSRVLDQGSVVLVDDGQIELSVVDIIDEEVHCRVVRGGTIKSRKGVNIPDARLGLPFMSERDASDIRFAVRQGADFIAASFVSEPDDVRQIRDIIEREGGRTAIIAKIESRLGVKNLAEIIALADGIMVARGDLGVEIRLEEVPVVQKQIVDACREAGKTVIVATEMLESMTRNPRPSRAETSDVANAIFEGTDAVMLSQETTVGKYPIDAVRTMGRIAEFAERETARTSMKLPGGARASEVSELICKGAFLAATELKVRAIIVPTSSGATALRISRYRPPVPILVTTPDLSTARRLALSYGVYAVTMRMYGRMENVVRRSCEAMVEEGQLARGDMIAVVAGVPTGRSGTTNLLTIQSVENLVGRVEEKD